ncbi:MAG: hypothetical protein II837_04380 [Treponema sp.]|nr:hypothetical protein [Treponema sp.]MBQ7167723.1 hypothetical protein [Treponema sp.]
MTEQKRQPQMQAQGRPAIHPRPLPSLMQQRQGQELKLPGTDIRLRPGTELHPP